MLVLKNSRLTINFDSNLTNRDYLIKLSNVYKTYFHGENTVNALSNINLKIKKGEFVTIIGQSGSGKSTLMNILGCLDIPTRGNYYIKNKKISTVKESYLSEIRNKTIGFIFQGFNLIPTLNALENVELPLVYKKVERKKRRSIAEECLKKVGLQNRMEHYPKQMSGGQQQRVAIARAIAGRPPIILADEPTGNLDSNSGSEILDILKNLNGSGHTIVLITHDDGIASQANRIVRIHDGQIISNL